MVAGEDHGRRAYTPPTDQMTFEIERFAWGGPDRLDVSGTFTGLRDTPRDDPVLVLSGGDGTHRLPVVPGSLSGPPEDGRLWWAEFAWQEPPVAFDNAELRFGDGLVVRLPEPDEQRSGDSSGAVDIGAHEAVQPGAAERIRLEAELIAANEEIRGLREQTERLRGELARARDDLTAERDRHTADAERFREGLARVQRSAEQALREAQDTIEAKDAALEEARRELQTAADAQAQEISDMRSESETLRQRLAALENARSAAEEATADIDRLVSRLTTIRDVLGKEDR